MTILDNMADYQQPPPLGIHDHTQQNGLKKRETLDLQKLKRRFGKRALALSLGLFVL